MVVDGDVPNLLVFAAGTELHKSWMVDEGHLILQDKVRNLVFNYNESMEDMCKFGIFEIRVTFSFDIP